jgi:hypothetical protein
MADTTMTDNLDASQQVLAAFQQLAPLMGVKTDPDLILSQNPSQPKRAKKDVAPGRRMVKQDEGPTALQDAVMLMARLLVRHDQALKEAQKETAFLFFFNNKAPTGSLKCLMAAAESWHQTATQQPRPTPWQPLRQRLLQALLEDLLTRLTNLGESDPKSPLVKAAQMNNVLLPDMTCPFLEWDASQKKLKVGSKLPISLKKMVENVQELIEMNTEVSLVQSFHALPTSGDTTPWKLTISMRADREYWLLRSLCGSSIWMLMATSMKAHSQSQRNLAQQLTQTLNLRPQKGKGKGKKK